MKLTPPCSRAACSRLPPPSSQSRRVCAERSQRGLVARRTRRIAGVVGLFLSVALWAALPPIAQSSPADAGGPASDADQPGARAGSRILGTDGEIDLARRAGRLTILHFWASWCEPCKEELPSLVSFYEGAYQRLADRGVVLLTVSLDVRRADLEAFVRERSLEIPVFLDSMGRIQEELGLWGLPGTVLIGPNLEVVDRKIGSQDWESREFLREIESHLQRSATRSREPIAKIQKEVGR